MDQGVFQLVPAAADVFFPGIKGERVGGFDRVAGLACGLKVDADLAGEDKAFGLFAAFTKAAFNQGMVESDHGWYRRDRRLQTGGAAVNTLLHLAEAVEKGVVLRHGFLHELFQQKHLGAADDGVYAEFEGFHGREGRE